MVFVVVVGAPVGLVFTSTGNCRGEGVGSTGQIPVQDTETETIW